MTPTLGQAADGDWSTLLPAPIDVANTLERRMVEVAVFSQLPDKSWALWDWVSGNEGCPPLGVDGFEGCHAFTAHMGWLNSNHFLPQAEDAFYHHHALALERAAACAAMGERVGDHPVVVACDREALLIEAIAHHYLQDAWSMGHMWQRWGSPEIADFSTALAGDAGLVSVKALGDAVGRASGIIHGSASITGLADAMCLPDDGVSFIYGGEELAGGGDLFLDRVEEGGRLFDQRELLFGCAAAAMRELYAAGASSLGPLGPSAALNVDLVDCFPQRATNRAIGLGAAVQLPCVVADEIVPNLGIRAVSEAYLAALGLEASDGPFDYVPLTSSILSAIKFFGSGLIDNDIASRWNEDMRGIQDALQVSVRADPSGTSLANGAMGPLLAMRPNAAYQGVASYTDPPLPWRPVAMSTTPAPRVEEAGNLIARTFVDAHVDDWCGVLHEAGDDEFSLRHLQERCSSLTEQGATEAETACDVCASFAEWLVFDPEPDVAASPELALPPICTILAGTPGIQAKSVAGDFDRAELARRWCAEAGASIDQLFVEVAFGCRGSTDAYTIVATVVDNTGAPLAGIDVTFSIDDVEIGAVRSDSAGEVRLVPPPYDGTAVLVAQTGTSRQQVKAPLSTQRRCDPCEGDAGCTSAIEQQFTVECPEGPACDAAKAEAICGCFSAGCTGAGGVAVRDGVIFESFCCGCL